jgi:hypothetical protein
MITEAQINEAHDGTPTRGPRNLPANGYAAVPTHDGCQPGVSRQMIFFTPENRCSTSPQGCTISSAAARQLNQRGASTRRKNMTYYESAEDEMITQARALKEIADHGLADEIGTFIDDMGDHQQYAAQDVLRWLGY